MTRRSRRLHKAILGNQLSFSMYFVFPLEITLQYGRLVAKRSVKLAEIARFKELKQILRSSDDNPPKPGAVEFGVHTTASLFNGSPDRGNKLKVEDNFSVFERLALRGKHEAMKSRNHSHHPFVTGTVTANPTISKVIPTYRNTEYIYSIVVSIIVRSL